MQENNNWISIADVMSALMIIFMFIAIVFMLQLQQAKNIYRAKLNHALHLEFDKDLGRWQAEITDDNIFRFNEPFKTGSAEIPGDFTVILADFFPRYVRLLSQKRFKKEIDEIRVEGHTSNGWGNLTPKEQIYLYNMDLSQKRASNVLSYCYMLEHDAIDKNMEWLERKLRANGMAFSQPIFMDPLRSVEDKSRSRRVEFKVATIEHKKKDRS